MSLRTQFIHFGVAAVGTRSDGVACRACAGMRRHALEILTTEQSRSLQMASEMERVVKAPVMRIPEEGWGNGESRRTSYCLSC
jgi:hypothetical protein